MDLTDNSFLFHRLLRTNFNPYSRKFGDYSRKFGDSKGQNVPTPKAAYRFFHISSTNEHLGIWMKRLTFFRHEHVPKFSETFVILTPLVGDLFTNKC